MSKVISFRLNPDNQRDAKAIAILQDWLSRGFSTRHTITEALLNLPSPNSEAADNSVLNDLSQQIKELLDKIGSDVTLNKPKDEMSSQKTRIDDRRGTRFINQKVSLSSKQRII